MARAFANFSRRYSNSLRSSRMNGQLLEATWLGAAHGWDDDGAVTLGAQLLQHHS